MRMACFNMKKIRFCYLLSLICLFYSAISLATGVAQNRLNNIDFQINKDKAAVIVVELASSASVIDVKKTAKGLSIELMNTHIPDDKLFVLDVSDFATVVDTIEVFRQPFNGRLDVEIKSDYQYSYQLNESTLEVIISKAVAKQQAEFQITSEQNNKPISINFQDIPVRSVLQLIADYNGFNLVVSDSVTGNITLRLDGVPWQKALNIILESRGLDKRIDGNVILIAPKSEMDLREQQQLEKSRMEETLGDLQSDIIKISFAKASDIAEMINGDGALTMLSERGSVSIDERTNALLVRELPENIAVIRDIVKSLDVPVKQVQIEARIVTVNEGDLEELGVRWGYSSTNGSHTSSATLESNLYGAGLYDSGSGEINSHAQSGLPIDDFLNVNLAATAAGASSIAFQVAKLGADTLLDLELSALQRESKAEIISSPRLITTNKKPAYIEQGTELPYLEASSSGATTVSFRKAVLSLMVTPQITPDNRLVLDLSVTQDRVGDVVKTGTGEAVAINTQRIGTQVLVNNGETVVLGGIFQHSLTHSVEKVPLLGDLPLLGSLFRRSYEKVGKSELLIFVTPKVVIQ